MIANTFLSLVLLALGSVVLRETSRYPDFSKITAVGPEVLPNLLACFFLGAAVFILLQNVYCLFIRKVDSDGVSYLQKEKDKVGTLAQTLKGNTSGMLGVVGSLALMALYALLMPKIGFEIATVLFLVGTMLCCGERKPLRLILAPVITMLAVYGVFVSFLHVSLPTLIFRL